MALAATVYVIAAFRVDLPPYGIWLEEARSQVRLQGSTAHVSVELSYRCSSWRPRGTVLYLPFSRADGLAVRRERRTACLSVERLARSRGCGLRHLDGHRKITALSIPPLAPGESYGRIVYSMIRADPNVLNTMRDTVYAEGSGPIRPEFKILNQPK